MSGSSIYVVYRDQPPAAAGLPARWRRGAGRRRTPWGGWSGLRSGYRGRFGMDVPPLLEALGLAELTHEPRGNRVRGVSAA